MDIDDIERIIRILKQNEVTDFELEQEGTKVKLTRGTAGMIIREAPVEVRSALPAMGHHAVAIAESEASANSALTKVESPIVGTFYRRASPDAEPFVKEGDMVKKGDTLCIIEAMKLMNEIEAETSGKLVRILPNEGQVVEYGEVLFMIEAA